MIRKNRPSRFFLLPSFFLFAFSLLTACSGDDDFTERISSVQVVEAQTSFEAAGGTNTILLKGGVAVEAAVADDWATAAVSGATVSVTAQMNSSRESRHTTLMLTAANGDQTVVPLSQEGMIFVVRSGDIVVGDDAQQKTIEVRHTLPVTIVDSPAWLRIAMNTSTMDLDFDANTTGYVRSGYVKYQSGLTVDSFQVRQGELRDIVGFYYMYFKDSPSSAGVHWTPAQITADEILVEEGVQRFRHTFDPATLTLHITSGQLVETVDLEDGAYAYFFLSFLANNGTWSAYRTDVVASLSFDFRPDWGNYGTLGGKFATNDISGYTFRLTGAPTFNADTDGGQGIEHYDVRFLKWRSGTASSDHPEAFSWEDLYNEWRID